jgi:hypothetical protein
MMAGTVSLALLIILLGLFLVFLIFKPALFSKRKIWLIVTLFLVSIVMLFKMIGSKKIQSDISRIIRNSSPKTPDEVYNILFKNQHADCVRYVNFKDQVLPTIDCCIWMEVKVCSTELNRILSLKNYTSLAYRNMDSSNFLQLFGDRPSWWTPQQIGDTIYKSSFQFNDDNVQSLFYGKDSSHLYICDMAR